MRAVSTLFARCARGTSAIEFALIVPVALLFLGGIADIGRAFQVYNAVDRLALRYATVWADSTDAPIPAPACQTEINQYTSLNALQNMAPQLNVTASNTTVRLIELDMVGTLPVPIVGCTSPLTGLVLTAPETTSAQNMIGAGNRGVVVTVQYRHSLQFGGVMASFFPNVSPWTISYTVAQRKS